MEGHIEVTAPPRAPVGGLITAPGALEDLAGLDHLRRGATMPPLAKGRSQRGLDGPRGEPGCLCPGGHAHRGEDL